MKIMVNNKELNCLQGALLELKRSYEEVGLENCVPESLEKTLNSIEPSVFVRKSIFTRRGYVLSFNPDFICDVVKLYTDNAKVMAKIIEPVIKIIEIIPGLQKDLEKLSNSFIEKYATLSEKYEKENYL